MVEGYGERLLTPRYGILPNRSADLVVGRLIKCAVCGRVLPRSVERVNRMGATGCEICVSIPDFAAANLREGERLPEAVLALVDAYPHPEGFWDTSKEYEITKECPGCGQLYTYNYYYEFSVGYVEERVWVERRRE